MKCPVPLPLHFFLWVCTITFGQQISVYDNLSPQELIQNHLVSGCVEAENVTSPINGSINDLVSYGFFERENSNFPFENGIVLSSGEITRIGNGEDNGIITSGNYEWGTDPAIEDALGISHTLNATTIQFEFSSISDRIAFNYIMASEEYYANFPCAFSDGFAFLIRKAGTNDPYENIAVVPGTNIPVNTTTIRPEISGFCDAQNEEYFAGFNLGDTNFNGRTAVLTAVANIIPFEVYEIKLVVADQNDTNYDTAVFIEGHSFGASINLGEDMQTCASQVLLNGDVNNEYATYDWYLDDVLIENANEPTYSATISGNYKVEATIALNNSNCVLTDDINLIIDTAQTAEPMSDYELCDTNNNGIQSFDLDSKIDEVLFCVLPSEYEISFHLNLEDAQNQSNAVEGSINNTSNPQVIHTRIEDLVSGCIIYSSFNLVVVELPEVIEPSPLVLCAPVEQDGQIAIDLNMKDEEITGGDSNLSVTYHSTLADAELGINPLVIPYVNTTASETLYASVLNIETGCINTTSLELQIIDEPAINTDQLLYLDACDQDHDGNAIFDLNNVIPLAIENTAGYIISFYETLEDAEANTNPIEDPDYYANEVTDVQTIYIRVEAAVSNCYSIAPVELHTNLLLTGTNLNNAYRCDEDGNGEEEFYFNSIENRIANGIPDITVTFHLTEEERDNEVNPIDKFSPFTNSSNPQTIYVNLYSPTCHEVSQFDLVVHPVIEFETVDTLYVCDEDQDGYTITDLSEFDEAVTFNEEGYTVRYFATQEDAENNTNALPRFYENTENPFTLYPRIIADQTGCGSTNSFSVVVQPAPVSQAPDPIVICDMDMDGYYLMNLNDIIPQVISSTENRTIGFYHSVSEAHDAVNEIENTAAYNAQTETIVLRIENATTGCYSIQILDIIVNTYPVIGTNGLVDQYLICENSSDGIADFVFSTRDAEIIGNQTGKETSYHLTQEDADNRVKAIDKNLPFLNTENPQTIFVRLENISDTSCYDTGSFEIYVSTNPEFNTPTDIITCDDMSNDGSEVIDFGSKIAEITSGYPEIELVTFHPTETDAINGTNILEEGYSNVTNPQTIFARIDDGTECQSISSFTFTLVSAPSVSMPGSLYACDSNFDGFEIFDLTEAEFEIYDIRQDDIDVTYHVTYEEAETGSNAISNPEHHNHNGANEAVYIRVTNSISNCYVILPIAIEVYTPPVVNDFVSYEICANDENYADLNLITPLAFDDTTGLLISYHANQLDALNNDSPLDMEYYYSNTSEQLYIRVEDASTGCLNTYAFQLVIYANPVAHDPGPIEYCDDNSDGQLHVNLSEKTSAILGNQNPNRFAVSYHLNQADALSGLNAMNTDYMATDGDSIFARVENLVTGCFNTTFFYIFINPLPVVDIADQTVCIDNLPLYVSAETGMDTDTYLWSTGQTSPAIEITSIGDYWVTVTTKYGCQTTDTFNVIESESATVEFTEVLDFSDPNNITITVSGIGDYMYILDDGEPQESNVFYNVMIGPHTITIIDLNGCAPITKEVVVVDAPKFFTPNNDGRHDKWHIAGVETLPGTEILIFDRYGKLITKLTSSTPGWDGTFNGSDLRADDYWFRAFVKRGPMAFEVTGHFSLKR
jgi:gliding motility-associated-like protein